LGINKFNFKSIAFTCFAVPMLLLIYGIVNSQGMRMAIAILGMKLYRVPLPGFSYMERVKNLRELDLAHVFAFFMLIAVWILSTALVEIMLFGARSNERLKTRTHIRFLYCLSAVVLICDVAMFYRGIIDQGGLLDANSSVTGIIATIGYSGLLAFVAYVHVMLKRQVF
jgi:hypothetical protein